MNTYFKILCHEKVLVYLYHHLFRQRDIEEKKLLKEIEQKSDKITPLINISWEKYV